VALEHTSVPRWPAQPPPVDPAARTVTILAFGRSAHPVARSWAAAAGTRARLVHRPEQDEDAAMTVRAEAAAARVGWRLMLAGPEADVLSARAEAIRLGAVPAEVGTHVTDTGLRRVLCLHCDAVTPARADVGATVPCGGCGRGLHVYHHVSRRRAAYMGFQADAEDA
jgi:hypothetical protein